MSNIMNDIGYSFSTYPIAPAPFLKCFCCGHMQLSASNPDKKLHCLTGRVGTKFIAIAVLRMFNADAGRYVTVPAGNLIPVLIGACDVHLPQLEKLRKLIIEGGSTITQNMVGESRK
jgi:hypothetical protein